MGVESVAALSGEFGKLRAVCHGRLQPRGSRLAHQAAVRLTCASHGLHLTRSAPHLSHGSAPRRAQLIEDADNFRDYYSWCFDFSKEAGHGVRTLAIEVARQMWQLTLGPRHAAPLERCEPTPSPSP